VLCQLQGHGQPCSTTTNDQYIAAMLGLYFHGVR
jgi:hypothetical protein